MWRRQRGPRRGRFGRWGRRAVIAVALALALSLAVVVAFVATRCYGSSPAAVSAGAPDGLNGYLRSEAFTFLTLPEWFIVFSADEYAAFVARYPPSGFPFLQSAAQYWTYYGAACDATRADYAFETGYHVMLGVIGVSQTIEYGLKAAYEGSIGRFTAWLFTIDTPEDRFGAAVAAEYGTFLHTTPWYRFPFFARLGALWRNVPLLGPHAIRKWERRAVLTVELAFKGVYGWLMGLGSQAAYGAEDLVTYARVAGVSPSAIEAAGGKPIASNMSDAIAALPRYEGFTPAAIAILRHGGTFSDIAGNDDIVLTALAPATATLELPESGRLVTRQSLPTDPFRVRVAIAVPVSRLGDAIDRLARAQATIEHLYDY